MSSGITLSAASRQNLLSLQGTADLLSTTQNRLSTGKKVNSALDNPTNFFTASALSGRSASLSALLDGVSNGIQTIQAANTGITKIKGLTDQLKSVAQQALASSNAFSAKATSISSALTGATATNLLSTGPTQALADTAIGSGSGAAVAAAATASGVFSTGTAQVTTGDAAYVGTVGGTLTINGTAIAIAAGQTQTQAIATINAQSSTTNVTASNSGGKLVLTSTKTDGSTFTAVQSGTNADLGFAAPVATTAAAAGSSGTLTINGTAIAIAAGTTETQAISLINAQSGTTGVTASDSTGSLKLTGASDGSSFTVQGSAGNTLGFSATAATQAGTFRSSPTTLATAIGFKTGDSFTVNGQSVNIAAGDNLSSIAQKVSTATNGSVTAAFDPTARKFTFTAADANTAVTLGNGSTATSQLSNLGFSAGKTSFAAGLGATGSTSPLTGNSLTVQVGAGASTSFTFGSAAGQISNLTQLNTALANVNAQATIDSSTGKLSITTSNDAGADNLTVTATGANNPFNSGTSGAIIGGDGATSRNGLVQTYNNLLTQITQLASDSGYNGVNLLAGDTLKLSFNEKNTSSLSVQGTAVNASNLGLNAVGTLDFQENSSINKVIATINSASTQLASQASSLGSNLAVVQNRQDFTKQIVNVLDTGSANLTNADLNEEAANSQALSTRNSLGISALSLANQAQQGVLQLLR